MAKRRRVTSGSTPAASIKVEPADEVLTDAPPADEELTDAPPADEKLTDAPTADEELTDAPPADEKLTDAPTADEELTDAPPAYEKLTDAPTADGELNADDFTVPPSDDPVNPDHIPDADHKPQSNNGSAAAATADADDGPENDPASIQNLLSPLPKDQLSSLLLSAALAHPDVLHDILRAVDADPAHRKIFVHGLGWDSTTADLAAAFSPYGDIEDCKAVTDKATGKSKGYGFVLFKHRTGARRALKEPQKKIGNHITSCQLASAGPVLPSALPVSEYTQRKIYVSNVGADLDPQKVLQFFSKYGEIEEGPLGLDKATGKPKGFCLFVYKRVESAKKALEEPHKSFEGQVLHCQKAVDGPKPNKLGFQQGATNFPRNANAGVMGGAGSYLPAFGTPGHLMAPSDPGIGFNQASHPAAAGLNPALGQALTAFLATQGAGLGLTELLGAAVNQGGPNPMMNSGVHGTNLGAMGRYEAPAAMQGRYGTMPRGQGGAGRGQGHMGRMPPYMGR